MYVMPLMNLHVEMPYVLFIMIIHSFSLDSKIDVQELCGMALS